MEEKSIITNERRFYPLLVSSGGLDPQGDPESTAVWERLRQIPEFNKKVLLSASIIENLYAAEVKFGWQPYCSARLAYFVRELFFQNISQTEFYKAVEALFLPQNPARFNEILSYINNTLLTSKPDPEEEEEIEEKSEVREEDVKQYTLLDALSKYPNLGNQFITTENIKLKSQVAPMRPTLSNWLKNYRDELGIGKHDSVARARFLFESLNTKKLPSVERDRIHAIIRSIEDNELLNINIKNQEIVFLYEEKESTVPISYEEKQKTESGPVPDLFERFQNQPSREELKNVGTQTFVGEKSGGEKRGEEAEAVLTRIKNMFVTPAAANAPAPKEDFFVPPVEAPKMSEGEPLGTLRFSAKHVLPAERQGPITLPRQSSQAPSKLEHFRPQPVPIPEESTNNPKPMVATGPQHPVLTPESRSAPLQKEDHNTAEEVPSFTPHFTVSPAPPVQFNPPFKKAPAVEQPTSIFRIKPNRD